MIIMREKIILLPVNKSRLNDLKYSLWSLSHIENIRICLIFHNLNSNLVEDYIPKYYSIKIDLIFDNISSNLSQLLNKAQNKYSKMSVFYRLDAGDLVHFRKFDYEPTSKNSLLVHSSLLLEEQNFKVKNYKGKYFQLFRNNLVHSSFAFFKAEYNESYKLAQDYELSLKKIYLGKLEYIPKTLVCKRLSIHGNTLSKRGYSILGSLNSKKEYLKKKFSLIIFLAIQFEKIKLIIWNLKK